MKIGEVISNYMSANDISLREFSRRTGISSGQISNYINGSHGDARESTLRKLAAAMNITFGDLIECLDDELEIEFNDNNIDKLLEEFVRLTKEEQDKVLEYAKFLRFSRTE